VADTRTVVVIKCIIILCAANRRPPLQLFERSFAH
jgi:hypothetical protein